MLIDKLIGKTVGWETGEEAHLGKIVGGYLWEGHGVFFIVQEDNGNLHEIHTSRLCVND